MPAIEIPCETTIHPGLSIIHANHMEDLREVAIQWICAHPLQPLENEVFVVQSNGMAQWLKLAMASNEGCGISAAVRMQLPARFLWDAYRCVLGEDRIPEQSPFDKERLTWRIYLLLPTLFGKKWFSPLERYLEGEEELRRYQLSRQLAELYDQYQVYRADWLHDWTEGADRLRNSRGKEEPLTTEQVWQAELWRYLYKDIPKELQHSGRFQLHRRFVESVERSDKRPKSLPRRVIVFGISSFPSQALEAIHAVSRHSQVLVFAHNPCRHHWTDILEDRKLIRMIQHRHSPKPSLVKNLGREELHQRVNPLLASWGKQGGEFIGLLYGYDKPDAYRNQFGEIDLFRDFVPSGKPAPLLNQVQQAILDLDPLPESHAPKKFIQHDDRSITFIQAHSRQREVEILQDQLLSFFAVDTSLRPQDVIVMTPDIETYSPHIDAVFGRLTDHDERYLPYTIADRTDAAGIGIFQAIETLLQLPYSRFTADDLFGLFSVQAFCQRFGIRESDLSLIQTWVENSGIRWGLNAEHRKSLGLPDGMEQNTWHFGLQRMLLGYAVGSGHPWQGIEPYDEIGGLDAALVGPLYSIVELLESYRKRLARPATPERWVSRLTALVNDFFLSVENEETLAVTQLREVLDQWIDACGEGAAGEKISLPVVKEAIFSQLAQSGISQRFLAGKVNFCTLMPMRAIPFTIVCLLGMNDGEFPRSSLPLDFDLMLLSGHYRPGDRSRREDDRYLFLEALLSARQKLYISFIGSSIRDNSERMPSVLVSQLKEYLAAGWQVETQEDSDLPPSASLPNRLTTVHPLQPFSPSYFQPDKWPDRFTYAHEWETVFHGPDNPAAPAPLPPMPTRKSLPLAPLLQFLRNPIRAFFNQRLNTSLPKASASMDSHEPFSLDSLAHFGSGMQLLEAGLAADKSCRPEAVAAAADRMRRTGILPLFEFGRLSVEKLVTPVQTMLDFRNLLLRKWADEKTAFEIEIAVGLEDAVCESVEDWLEDLRPATGQTADADDLAVYARWEYYPGIILDKKKKLRYHPIISAWVKHLAACSQGLDLTTYVIASDGVAEIAPIHSSTATQKLKDLCFHWSKGLQSPLPATAKTALAYMTELKSKDMPEADPSAYQAAQRVYEGNGFNDPGELGYGDGIYLRRVYPNFEMLWESQGNAFKQLAQTLYLPIIDATTESALTLE